MVLTRCRSCSCLLAIFAVLIVSSMAAGPAAPDAKDTTGEGYRFHYQFEPDAPLYYVIENEFRDSGGVPGWLSYSTQIKDKRVVIQRAQAPATQPAGRPDRAGNLEVIWECDRYEVREKGMKGEVTFDSLRDLYPPPSLYGLGAIPGSRTSFWLDRQTGRAAEFQMTPAQVQGQPPTARRLSRTATRCSLTTEMFENLLYDLGPLFLPPEPQQVGDTWTKVRTAAVEPFGTVVTQLSCTLRSVRKINNSEIASIDLQGVVSLPSPPEAAPPPVSTGPGAARTNGPAAGGAEDSVPPEAVFPSTNPADEIPLSGPRPATQPMNGGPPSTSAPVDARPIPATQAAATQPLTSGPSRPTTRPAAPAATTKPDRVAPKSNKSKNFVLDKAVCTGTIEFDLTRGELVQLTLRRDISGASKLEQTSTDPMMPTEIRAGAFQELRVMVSRTPPSQPVIVGGRKPPIVPPDELEPPKGVQPGLPRTTAPAKPPPMTQPAGAAPRPIGRTTQPAKLPTTVGPGAGRPPPKPRPQPPATQPVRRPPTGLRKSPASQPANRPD